MCQTFEISLVRREVILPAGRGSDAKSRAHAFTESKDTDKPFSSTLIRFEDESKHKTRDCGPYIRLINSGQDGVTDC